MKKPIINLLVPIKLVRQEEKKVWAGVGSLVLPNTKATVLLYIDTEDESESLLGAPFFSAVYHN